MGPDQDPRDVKRVTGAPLKINIPTLSIRSTLGRTRAVWGWTAKRAIIKKKMRAGRRRSTEAFGATAQRGRAVGRSAQTGAGARAVE
eukprot:2103012-Prymnesium_polylepis.1